MASQEPANYSRISTPTSTSAPTSPATSPAAESASSPATFNSCLKQALEHVNDAEWLGKNSPLCAPYFLGRHLRSAQSGSTPAQRGQVLRQLLEAVLSEIGAMGDEGAYTRQLLDLSYFRPKSQFDILATLHVGRSTYYRHLASAVNSLEHHFIKHAQPSVRIEHPNQVPGFVGRTQVIEESLGHLCNGKTVGLIGAQGVGKTSTASMIARQWTPDGLERTFWYTFVQGFNDRIEAVLFALAHFFHSLGASNLLTQMVADRGIISADFAVSLLRNDLGLLAETLPPLQSPLQCTGDRQDGASYPVLFCFDEVDVLRVDENPEHAIIGVLMTHLKAQAPMLIVGQVMPRQRVLEVDYEYTLNGLRLDELLQLASNLGTPVGLDQAVRWNYSGNPQLFKLGLTLSALGGADADLGNDSSDLPFVDRLLVRIMKRVDSTERKLIELLSVFRAGAPADPFDAESLNRLTQRGLVRRSDFGEVSVSPIFRHSVLAQMRPEQRSACHQVAAQILSLQAQYTEAAYHLLHAGEPSAAIHLWYPHRHEELDQGNGAMALSLFRDVAPDALTSKDRSLLKLLVSELHFLSGDLEQASQRLSQAGGEDDRAEALALELRGRILHRQGKLDDAMHVYDEALHMAAWEADMRQASIRMNQSWGWRSKLNFSQAWRESRLALCEIELVQGYVLCDIHEYTRAREHYQRAISIAEEQRYGLGKAKGHDYLALLARAEGNIEEALHEWTQASHYYMDTNNPFRAACVKANQAQLYLDSSQLDTALMLAVEALSELEIMTAHQAAAGVRGIIAQVHLAKGRLDEAERWAQEVINADVKEYVRVGFFILGKIRLMRGATDEALRLIEACVRECEAAQDEAGLVQSLKALIQAYIQGGRLEDVERARQRLAQIEMNL